MNAAAFDQFTLGQSAARYSTDRNGGLAVSLTAIQVQMSRQLAQSDFLHSRRLGSRPAKSNG